LATQSIAMGRVRVRFYPSAPYVVEKKRDKEED
jgi:hypothetical protein